MKGRSNWALKETKYRTMATVAISIYISVAPTMAEAALEQSRDWEVVTRLAIPTKIHSALLPRWSQGHAVVGIKEKKMMHTYIQIYTHICIHIWIHLIFSIKEKACRLWVALSRSSCTLEFFYGWCLAVIPLPCVGSLEKINTLASAVAV